MLRVAYPHPGFPDAPYERTAKTIEDAGRTDDVLVTAWTTSMRGPAGTSSRSTTTGPPRC